MWKKISRFFLTLFNGYGTYGIEGSQVGNFNGDVADNMNKFAYFKTIN